MAEFAVDASAALTWCFEDEATRWSDGLLERLRQGDQIVVPAHWPAEILNALLIAVRRKRLASDRPVLLWNELERLPIQVEPPLAADRAATVLALGAKHGLTVYDAAYLEIAMRRQLALGTLDADLRRAAPSEGVTLL